MVCAQTGSGKTASFLIPQIVKMIIDEPPRKEIPPERQGNSDTQYPVLLILEPTRELA